MDRKRQHCRAVTSLALLERARAWEWVKDPPAGEGQVGQIQHREGAVTSPLLRFLSPGNGGTEGGVKTIEEGLGEKVEPSLERGTG